MATFRRCRSPPVPMLFFVCRKYILMQRTEVRNFGTKVGWPSATLHWRMESKSVGIGVGLSRSIRVLLAESDFESAKSTAAMLHNAGYVVCWVNTVDAALHSCQGFRPDIFISATDVNGVPGSAVCAEVLRVCPATKCVILTNDMEREAISLGAVKIVPKILVPEVLREIAV